MVQVLDNGARIQYTTQTGQTIFTYPFLIFEDTDLLIYLRGPSDPVDPPGELLTLNVDYTVQGADNENGGTITLTSAPVANSILTIERDVPATQLVDFTVGGKFTGETLNFVMDKLTLLIQQNEMLLEDRGLLYLATEELGIGQTTLPKLPPNTGAGNPIWTANGAGNLVAAVCDETTTCSTLRSELLSQTEAAPGTDNVGFFDPDDGGVTLTDELLKILNRRQTSNQIIGGDFGNNPWQRNTTFSQVGASTKLTADRFKFVQTNALHDTVVSKDTGDFPPASSFKSIASLKVTNNAVVAPAAGDEMWIGTLIEGYRIQDVIKNKFTLSFWVKSNKTGIYSVAFINSGNQQRWVSEFNINSASTWEFKTITVDAPTLGAGWVFDKGIGLTVSFYLSAGASFLLAPAQLDQWLTAGIGNASDNQVNFADNIGNEFLLQGVQLKPGTVTADDFDFRSFDEELQLCLRYFEKSYIEENSLGTITKFGALRWGGIIAASDVFLDFIYQSYQVKKRIIPAVTIFNPNSGTINSVNLWDLKVGVSIADRAVVGVTERGDNSIGIVEITPATPLTADEYWQFHWAADAEL